MENYHRIIIKVVVGVGILLGLFLLAATLTSIKEYHFIGSGINATNTISVSGQGKVERAPDTAKLSFTVESTAKDVKSAQDAVSKKSSQVQSDLLAAGVDKKYLTTESYNSYPQYDYPSAVYCMGGACPRPGSPILKGYVVSQSMSVSIKNLEIVDKVVSVLGRDAVTNMSGPNFGFDDDKAIAREARDKAIADAQSEAQKLAMALGVHLVRIVSFNEQGSGAPMPMYKAMAMGGASDSAAAPSLPSGVQKVTSNVTLVYEIR